MPAACLHRCARIGNGKEHGEEEEEGAVLIVRVRVRVVVIVRRMLVRMRMHCYCWWRMSVLASAIAFCCSSNLYRIQR